MKTAVKVFAVIGVVTALLAAAAVVTHFFFAENKKYFPVDRKVVEV